MSKRAISGYGAHHTIRMIEFYRWSQGFFYIAQHCYRSTRMRVTDRIVLKTGWWCGDTPELWRNYQDSNILTRAKGFLAIL